jgi:hypothetical protein
MQHIKNIKELIGAGFDDFSSRDFIERVLVNNSFYINWIYDCDPLEYKYIRAISGKAVSPIKKIEDSLYELGWTKFELYANVGSLKYPYGPGWGLVCSLSSAVEDGWEVDILEFNERYIKYLVEKNGIKKSYTYFKRS